MDRNYYRSTGRVETSATGIVFRRGKTYSYETKIRVGQCYYHLFHMNKLNPDQHKYPTTSFVAKTANVGYKFAKKVMHEIHQFGAVLDPDIIKAEQLLNKKPITKLSAEQRVFILSLHVVMPNRPNQSYVDELQSKYNVLVCSSTITNFFKSKLFQHKGTFGKPNNVPLDKFRQENIVRFYEFQNTMQRIGNKLIINWLDEKHIVNSDCIPKKVRRNPVFGYMPAIMVSGDFRDSYNIFACISANPEKLSPMAYNIQKNNGCAVSFVYFIEQMITTGWLRHNECLIMDNAAIHTGKEADIIEGLLWNTIVNGSPLRILVVYLPTRSPELNPIELIFHILSMRVCSYKYTQQHKKKYGDDKGQMVVKVATDVMDEMEYATVRNCIVHCGYDI